MKADALPRPRCFRRSRRGAMLVFVAVSMIVFLLCAAFTIDVGYMQLVRTELQAATDASAKAGVVELSATQDEGKARQRAVEIALANTVAGDPFILAPADVVLGASTQSKKGDWVFTAGAKPANAVQVNAKRTQGSGGGAVQLLFRGGDNPQFFEPVQTAIASHVERDIVLVLDRSGSMAWDLSGVDWSYPNPGGSDVNYCKSPHATLSRWAAVVQATEAFLAELDKTKTTERVGMCTYASPGTWCDATFLAADIEEYLTSNYGTLKKRLKARSTKPIPGGTSISSGIDAGIKVLLGPNARPLAKRTMVLLTDGVHNSGPSPIDSTPLAVSQFIKIHTITFSNGADQAQMKQVAAATGGNHYHAPDAAALTKIFKEIANSMPAVLTD